MRFTTVLLLTLCGMLVICSQEANASIGEVTLHEGNGTIERKSDGSEVITEKQVGVFSYDTVKTGNGKTGIEFIDDTRVDVTSHSKLIIDDFVYDPNTKTGKLSLKASLGTIRSVSYTHLTLPTNREV